MPKLNSKTLPSELEKETTSWGGISRVEPGEWSLKPFSTCHCKGKGKTHPLIHTYRTAWIWSEILTERPCKHGAPHPDTIQGLSQGFDAAG